MNVSSLSLNCYGVLLVLHSFPTRRSSDLDNLNVASAVSGLTLEKVAKATLPFTIALIILLFAFTFLEPFIMFLDRKSTRLNSSHVAISYAVFCLKKKIETCAYLYVLALCL